MSLYAILRLPWQDMTSCVCTDVSKILASFIFDKPIRVTLTALKMEAKSFSETSVYMPSLHSVVPQNINVFIIKVD
jgi:hypothetical protein